MENSGNKRKKQEKTKKFGGKPPGQFVTNELEEQTARFIEDVKSMAQRRKKSTAEEGSGPPPRGAQRSKRR